MRKVRINNVKYENEICHVCLSEDRNLFSISLYHDIFFKLVCENFKACSTPLLCWECTALLKKVKIFQDNAKLSYEVLYQEIRQENMPIPKLSKLQKTYESVIYNYTYFEDCKDKLNNLITRNKIEENFNVNNENTTCDIKEEIEDTEVGFIKDELCISESEDYFVSPHFNNDINDAVSTVASANVDDNTTVKKGKTKPRVKHKVIKEKLHEKEIDKLTLKIQIQCYEMKQWLKRDRCSEEYKQWQFKCEKCVRGWHREKNLLEHDKHCHNSKFEYECDVCSRRFMEKCRLSLHLNTHRYIQECRTCAYRAGPFVMKQHLATHGRLVQCLECDAKFTRQRLFYQHYKHLHAKFICDYCGKVCKTKNVIAKHIHHNHGVFECKICNINFKRRGSYLQHRNKKHSVSNGDDAYCVPCDKKFFNVYVYKSHLKYSSAHAHERKSSSGRERTKISCPDCGKVYTRKSYMMNHYRHVHMKRSNYHCAQCDQYFLNNTKYLNHMKYRHEGATKEKNKLCNICGRGFAANRTLLNHIRTHSGERPYECEYCGAKFIQKYAMLSHVSNIHLKNKHR